MKTCSKIDCRQINPQRLEAFYKKANNKYTSWCKPCTLRQQKDYAFRNKDRIKKYLKEYNIKNKIARNAFSKVYNAKNKEQLHSVYLLKKYGITLEQKKAMFLSQNELCKICLAPFKNLLNANTDHHHSTGVVRGLLCVNCNLGIGNFKDNPNLLILASKYLKGIK